MIALVNADSMGVPAAITHSVIVVFLNTVIFEDLGTQKCSHLCFETIQHLGTGKIESLPISSLPLQFPAKPLGVSTHSG